MSPAPAAMVRFKTALAQTGLKGVAIASQLGISKAFLGQVITRGRPEHRLEQIAAALGVPAEWLIHGTGPAPAWAAAPAGPDPAVAKLQADLALAREANGALVEQVHQLGAYEVCVAIGQRLMWILHDRRMSPDAVVAQAGVPYTSFGRLMTSPMAVPTNDLAAIARVLGVEPGTILTNTPPFPGWEPWDHGATVTKPAGIPR